VQKFEQRSAQRFGEALINHFQGRYTPPDYPLLAAEIVILGARLFLKLIDFRLDYAIIHPLKQRINFVL
jgi:hypothetical protein